jgi:hypothetical protein
VEIIHQSEMPRVNQEIAKALFEKLINAGKPVLYRNEPVARISKKLAQTGFDESKQLANEGMGGSSNEALGIFNALKEDDLSSLIWGRPSPPSTVATMETVPLPSARIKSFSQEEWKNFLGDKMYTPSVDITKRLKSDYDFVEIPDNISRNINPETGEVYKQMVQINKNKGLAKFRPFSTGKEQVNDLYRILSAAGIAVPSIGAFQPETEPGE